MRGGAPVPVLTPARWGGTIKRLHEPATHSGWLTQVGKCKTVVACLASGCGKTVEGATGKAIRREHNQNCVIQGSKCDKECGSNSNSITCCHEMVHDCWYSNRRRGPAVTDKDIKFCTEHRSREN